MRNEKITNLKFFDEDYISKSLSEELAKQIDIENITDLMIDNFYEKYRSNVRENNIDSALYDKKTYTEEEMIDKTIRDFKGENIEISNILKRKLKEKIDNIK
jgi:polysaccharide deacetylase 2 family uncharacterized protein YibQ